MTDPKFIGKTYGPAKYEIGLEKIKEFAMATGDMNPAYLDEDAAAKGPHKGIVAPPMFAVVYMKEIVGKMLFDGELDLNMAMLVHGEQEFYFYDVVKPHDVVISEGKLVGVVQKDEKNIVTLEVNSAVGGRPVAKGLYTFVVRG